ncbi:cupredoxin family protein (plasmid) [Marivivens sp. LCG002]|uniref:cupredoxin domain-containing protein n=1 Tax=Marivivens sp. LCG002 TaxID=3051171 RepID=UPI00255518D9|nr:cupredoxin family protein [Marivivens sp. LCG002]WIV52352.1 cupredoxin family protein [Marivivens sp. LCG002]
MKTLALTAALLVTASAAMADGGHAHADDWEIGRPGNPADVTRTIEVDMFEPESGGMAFSMSQIDVTTGETIRFVVTNKGYLDHEMVIDTMDGNAEHAQVMMMKPDMVHHDPNAVRLAPGETGEIVWTFSQTGNFEFACLIPGHMESGMHGPLNVN